MMGAREYVTKCVPNAMHALALTLTLALTVTVTLTPS